MLHTIRRISVGMLGIWKNFLFGWNGLGRPIVPLIGLIILGSFFTSVVSIQAASSGYLGWLLSFSTFCGWVFGVPSMVYVFEARYATEVSR